MWFDVVVTNTGGETVMNAHLTDLLRVKGLGPKKVKLLNDKLGIKSLEELKAAFRKWRRIGWKNVCKLWLDERSPEQLKGEGG